MRLIQYLLILILSAQLMGCGNKRISQSDRDAAIQERLQEIETIKSDNKMNPELKRDLIERSQQQLDELRGESIKQK